MVFAAVLAELPVEMGRRLDSSSGFHRLGVFHNQSNSAKSPICYTVLTVLVKVLIW